MARRLILKDSNQFTEIADGYIALVSENGNLKKQVKSTLTDISNTTGLTNAELGFTITPISTGINQDVILPDNAIITYPSPLIVNNGHLVTVPSGSTLTIV